MEKIEFTMEQFDSKMEQGVGTMELYEGRTEQRDDTMD